MRRRFAFYIALVSQLHFICHHEVEDCVRTSWINTLRVSGSSGIVRVGLFDTSVEETSCRDSIGDVCFRSCDLDVSIACGGSGSSSVSFWFDYHHKTRSAANSPSF